MSILLEDVSIRTMIGQLPRIINNNNKSLSDYINKFYDSDNNCITVSIDNSSDNNNFVNSYAGYFVTLTVNTLVLNDADSFVSLLAKKVPHSILSDKYLYNNAGEIEVVPEDSLPTGMDNYAHNAGAIGVGMKNGSVKSLLEVLNNIIADVSTLGSKFSGSYDFHTTLVGVYGSSNVYGVSEASLEEPDSFTFDNDLLFANKLLLKKMNLPTYQYNDLTSGYIYTYYNYSNVITISDEHTASISGIPGSVTTIRFNDTKTKAYYRILLSRKDKKYLRISKDELNRLTLICVGNDNTYGTTWEVNNYSVRSAEDIMIETK